MWAFIGLLSILSAIVFVVLGIVSKLKKNKKASKNFIVAGISSVVFIIAMIASPATKAGTETTVALETHEAPTASIALDAPASVTKTPTLETPSPSPSASPGTKPQQSTSPTGSNKEPKKESIKSNSSYDIKIVFPAARYPQTATHIKQAINKGESAVCTIDRKDADVHREKSLADIPTKKNYDRDEWPMAMCAEGGTRADIAYISPSDNRGAGSWVSHELTGYSDGTRVLFVISGGKTADIAPATKSASSSHSKSSSSSSSKSSGSTSKSPSPNTKSTDKTAVYYTNCTAVRAAGKAPLYKNDPGYSRKLDRDGDGVACEK